MKVYLPSVVWPSWQDGVFNRTQPGGRTKIVRIPAGLMFLVRWFNPRWSPLAWPYWAFLVLTGRRRVLGCGCEDDLGDGPDTIVPLDVIEIRDLDFYDPGGWPLRVTHKGVLVKNCRFDAAGTKERGE